MESHARYSAVLSRSVLRLSRSGARKSRVFLWMRGIGGALSSRCSVMFKRSLARVVCGVHLVPARVQGIARVHDDQPRVLSVRHIRRAFGTYNHLSAHAAGHGEPEPLDDGFVLTLWRDIVFAVCRKPVEVLLVVEVVASPFFVEMIKVVGHSV